ncbi:hypothetical protein DUI87_10818 [Hirundo rustica rustica]|uniref:Uncharacterized protein n=1 Tax=Hirundo rustica rustica TaxID=333673 RepID=A0A3M0KJN2_HIRRU|nr:hypothetical protein DUI87_10818 [Hirundo rustica rustica]
MKSLQAFMVTVFSEAHVYTRHKLKDSTKDQGLVHHQDLSPELGGDSFSYRMDHFSPEQESQTQSKPSALALLQEEDEGHHCTKTMLDADWCPYPILPALAQKFQWDTKAVFGLASTLTRQKSKADGAEVPMSTPYPYRLWFGLDLVWLPDQLST